MKGVLKIFRIFSERNCFKVIYKTRQPILVLILCRFDKLLAVVAVECLNKNMTKNTWTSKIRVIKASTLLYIKIIKNRQTHVSKITRVNSDWQLFWNQKCDWKCKSMFQTLHKIKQLNTPYNISDIIHAWLQLSLKLTSLTHPKVIQ